MNPFENILVALRAIRSNFLRSFLTLMIIAIGITCLVGILTAIDSILFSMSSSFNQIGANSFSIIPKRENLRSRRDGRSTKRAEVITFDQAMDFKEKFDFSSSEVSIASFCTGNATVKFGNEKTNPTVSILGIDENYLDVSSFELETGRNFNSVESLTGSPKAIIGLDIVKSLFNDKVEKAMNAIITINADRYKVVGVIASKGSTMNQSSDRQIFIPLMNAKKLYHFADKNYSLTAAVKDISGIDDAISTAIGKMRNVRRLKASEENDFEIRKSDGILERLKEVTTELRLGTIAIALITLLGAAIGLMNIMLVSVTERTKEIGLRKALGATKQNILIQFITEAIVICQLGGLAGILLGILVGNAVSIFTNGPFIIPWPWIALGVVVCVIVGLVSGLYPAFKAANQDPIEALRHE
jgi:putative ABC transport system permease protein